MGRYKSVLMAKKDAREFPHHVRVPVPAHGLGKRLITITDWLDKNFGNAWRMHSRFDKGVHTVGFMFRTEDDATLFGLALTQTRELDQ